MMHLIPAEDISRPSRLQTLPQLVIDREGVHSCFHAINTNGCRMNKQTILDALGNLIQHSR
ncbi:hypothetical protein BofuT4_P091850.1 [Botrytis cinerea T4]|uniref:Uncharacterized protein n=1 Tax=Botryotinia fuckeliana (strain T4) TaxID=999810 RepID=G2YEM8_BOTF4|nr:hypothetical protein BofuT4_P091850.1 [Botrytis cinerea T4]